MEVNDSISQLDSLSLGDGSLRSSASNPEEEESILNKTSNLTLDDASSVKASPSQTPAFSPFLRHYPARPSPLRRSYSNDNDTEMLDGDQAEEDSDLVMEDISNHSFSEKFGKTTSLILSPTILGARIATSSPISGSPHRVNLLDQLKTADNDDEKSDLSEADSSITSSIQESSSFNSIKPRNNKPSKSSGLSKYVITQDSEDEDTEQDTTGFDDSTTIDSTVDSSNIQHYQTPVVRTRWGNQPIQLQMHHHHYYPSTPQTPGSSDDSDSLLPAPWSKFAKPKAPAPYLISSYLQLIFNAVTSGIILYILISAIKTVRSDINSKIDEYQTNLIIEIQYCSKNYYENKCDPSTRVSALEKLCIDWERCMNRDPTQVASKSSVSAETLGVILNSLIEPIGAKAIVVFILGFIVWSFTSNFIFGFVRAKSYYGWKNNGQNNNGLLEQQGQQQLNFNQTPMKAIQLNDGYYTSTPSR